MLTNLFSTGLVLLACALPFSIALSSLIFFPLLAVWLLGGRHTLGPWKPAWNPVEKAYAVFIAVSVISSLSGIDPAHSFHEIYKKDLYILILVLVASVVRDRASVDRCLRWFLFSGFLSCLWGLIQFFVGVNQTDKSNGVLLYVPPVMASWPRLVLDYFSLINGRVRGTYSHPLFYAEALLFVLAFVLCFVSFEERRRWLKWVPLAWLCGAAVIVSQSRGPWMAALGMGLLLLGARFRLQSLARFAVLALPVLALFILPSLRTRAASISDPTFHSNLERLHMWHAGWQLWKNHPILGIGPGNVKRASPAFQTASEKEWGSWGHLHSTYVNFAVERGLLGLVAYGIFVAMLLVELVRGIRRCRGRVRDSAILWGCVAGVLGMLISGLTETTYNTVIISMTFYFVMGLGLALARGLNNESTAS